MSEPSAPPPFDRETALIDVARVIVASALTIGSVLLTAFGFVERVVGIDKIASDRGFALLALMPGAAALAFLASGRALGALYDVSVPPRTVPTWQRALLRFTDISGAYGFFAVVISGLVGMATFLSIALVLDLRFVILSSLSGVLAFCVALSGMLMRYSPRRRLIDLALFMSILAAMVLDQFY
ncbi:MAG: hypothetical protein Q8O26_08775 [Phreatobacter sp.]|uniref:hypothetical protein n=1 Tax=Phreatobacter sp. TaxID=1966341 RepID=UPI0027374650|nr:hypothetical protein [Phreatobacter sp.]MDP2801961.1 hypothetical protein [Phreatobacter sp.]